MSKNSFWSRFSKPGTGVSPSASITPSVSSSVSWSISPSISPSTYVPSHVRVDVYPPLAFCVKCHAPVYRQQVMDIPCRVRCVSCLYDGQVFPFKEFDCSACSKRVDCMILDHCEAPDDSV